MSTVARTLKSGHSWSFMANASGRKAGYRRQADTTFQIAIVVCIAAILATALVSCSYAPHKDLVLFQQTATAAQGNLSLLGGLPVKMLNTARDGRQVAVAELPPDWKLQLAADRQQTLELLVLAGRIAWNGIELDQYDFAFLPSEAPAARLATGTEPARVLAFLDPPRRTDGQHERLLRNAAVVWRPGVVAQKDTGQQLALEVKDLLWIESTGQRTWLLRAGPDLSVPWEVHTGVEEGFLLEGDYRIGECLPDGPVIGDYSPGGYFYRPGGIIHSGPDSGTQTRALWLLRTPSRLTVEFVDGCASKKN